MTEHKGLPVAGYVAQSDAKVALVNQNKELEERVLRQIDAIRIENECRPLGQPHIYDPRMTALAQTKVQEAFMWLNRAIFQPQRVTLPEDIGGPNNG